LGDAESACGGGVAQGFGDGLEVAEVPEVHGREVGRLGVVWVG
jgi:hypothetical protein